MLSLVRLLGVCLTAFLIGCGHSPTIELHNYSMAGIELTDAPFFPQRRNQCGAASLATVLAHRGIATSAVELEPFVYLPEREGSLNLEIVSQVRRHDLLAIPINTLDGLLKEVADGTPVLVMQNLGLSWLPQWHFSVVIGFLPDSQQLILRSGDNPRRFVHITTFMATWERSGFWGVAAFRPDQIPQSVTSDVYIQAAIAMEQVGKIKVAKQAYLTAFNHWPSTETYLAQLGLANIAYAQNQKMEAKRWLTMAIQEHHDKVAVWNNLAFLMVDFACYRQAQQLMECALNRFPDHPLLLSSRQEIGLLTQRTLSNTDPDGANCFLGKVCSGFE